MKNHNGVILFTVFAITMALPSLVAAGNFAKITVQCPNQTSSFTIIQPWGEIGHFSCGSDAFQGLKAERSNDGFKISLVGSNKQGPRAGSTGQEAFPEVLDSLYLSEGISGSLGDNSVSIVTESVSANPEVLRQMIEADKSNVRMEAERRGLKITDFSQSQADALVCHKRSQQSQCSDPTLQSGDTCCVTCGSTTVCAEVVIHDCGSCCGVC